MKNPKAVPWGLLRFIVKSLIYLILEVAASMPFYGLIAVPAHLRLAVI